MVGELSSILNGAKPSTKAKAKDDPDNIDDSQPLGSSARVAVAKWCHGLNVIRRGKHGAMFQYQYLAVHSEFSDDWTWFWVVFAGQHEMWKVKVIGRNLRRYFYCVKEHRLEEIREPATDKDFAADGEEIVLKIEVTPIESAPQGDVPKELKVNPESSQPERGVAP